MTPGLWALVLGYFAFMAALIAAYRYVVRRVSRDTLEAIHRAAVRAGRRA